MSLRAREALLALALAPLVALCSLACGGSVGEGVPDGAVDAPVDSVAIDTARGDVSVEVKPPFDASTTCPPSVPTHGTPCGVIRFACTYPGACGEDFAQCVDGNWNVIRSTCTTDYCPIAGPLPGGSCATEGFVCEYPLADDAGLEPSTCKVCVCKAGAFVCDAHSIAECPLRTCRGGDPCTTPGMIGCEYGGKCGTSCRCEATGALTCSTRLC